MGHAWQALALAARAIGCDSFTHDEIAQSCRLHQDERPMLVVEFRDRSIPLREPDTYQTVWCGGTQMSFREKEPLTRGLTRFTPP
jgi:hypothetical protein